MYPRQRNGFARARWPSVWPIRGFSFGAIQPLILSLDREIEIAPMQFYEYSIFLESTQLSIRHAIPRTRANPLVRCRIIFPVSRPIRRGNSVSTAEIIFAQTSNRDLSTEQCLRPPPPPPPQSNLLPIEAVSRTSNQTNRNSRSLVIFIFPKPGYTREWNQCLIRCSLQFRSTFPFA